MTISINETLRDVLSLVGQDLAGVSSDTSFENSLERQLDRPQETLIRNLKEHSRLRGDDIAEICNFSFGTKELSPDEDFIHQGDYPEHAVLVVSGMVARYHLLKGGRRQFLSFHMSGDLPDAQGLFIERMDHAL